MRGLAVELARHKIRCNSLLPGWTDTELLAGTKTHEKFLTATIGRTPVRRSAGEPRCTTSRPSGHSSPTPRSSSIPGTAWSSTAATRSSDRRPWPGGQERRANGDGARPWTSRGFPATDRPSRSCSGSGGPGSATANARDTVVADHVRRARRPFRPDGRSAGEGGGRQGQERRVLRLTVSVTSGSAAWTRVRTSRQRRRCRGCIPGTASRPAPRLRPTPSRHSGNPAGTRRARGQCGDITGAITELRQLLTDQQRVLGSGHPLTLTIRGTPHSPGGIPAPHDRR